MSNQQKIILLGAGGHCKSCIEVISDLSQHSIFGIIDKDGSDTKNLLGYDILGTDKDLDSLIKYCTNALITVGQIKSPAIRISLFERAKIMKIRNWKNECKIVKQHSAPFLIFITQSLI